MGSEAGCSDPVNEKMAYSHVDWVGFYVMGLVLLRQRSDIPCHLSSGRGHRKRGIECSSYRAEVHCIVFVSSYVGLVGS